VLTPDLAWILKQALGGMNERGDGHVAGNGHTRNGKTSDDLE
jgi:hypothetical protein